MWQCAGASGSIGEFSSCRSGPGASGRRFRSPGRGCARKNTGRHVLPCFGSQLHTTEGGQAKNIDFWPFCTFLTRVAITAPRRPERIKPGPKAARVLGNQPAAGFTRRFGRLARQHVRCGAHMRLFQGQNKCPWGAKLYLLPATFYARPAFGRKRRFRSTTIELR